MGHGFLPWSLKPDLTSVPRRLAYVTGLVNQELLLKNEYLLAENRILKAHLQPGFRLSRPERTALAELGKRLGRKLRVLSASLRTGAGSEAVALRHPVMPIANALGPASAGIHPSPLPYPNSHTPTFPI